MVNILYIGNYRDPSGGWSDASAMWIRALQKAYPDTLAIRPFRYDPGIRQRDNFFQELEKRTFDHYDVIIQNVLPMHFRNMNETYNIGISYFESNGILLTGYHDWAQRIRSMNACFCSTKQEMNEITGIGGNPVFMPQSIDKYFIGKCKNRHILGKEKKYRFYNIGASSSPRKNLFELLLAYKLAFSHNDHVELVLKVSNMNYYQQVSERVKRIVGDRNPYVLIIEQQLSDEEMISLHKECDCYVSFSSGESISRPLLEACAVGNSTLVTNNTAMCDINPTYTIDSYRSPCIVDQPPIPGIYTYREWWHMPIVSSGASMMRQIFLEKPPSQEYDIDRYDFKTVSRKLAEFINNANAQFDKKCGNPQSTELDLRWDKQQPCGIAGEA